MGTIVANIRERRLAPLLKISKEIYNSELNIEEYQLKQFNNLWANIQRNVEYYRELTQASVIPKDILSWDDFATLPIMSRAGIQENPLRYIDHSHKISGWSSTGGSTGTPFRVPYSKSEQGKITQNVWLGRDFYNVRVSDRMFHLWGHSHLFGSGWQRHIKQLKRQIKNSLLGYWHFSAYKLTPERLREAGQLIIRMRPDYIVGYSRSLTLLARENLHRASIFKNLGIKAVIATTEAFIEPENDTKLLEQVFNCPVAMEYGAVETGAIAYTHPSDQHYHVFWDSFLIEAVPIDEVTAKLLVTSLYPRAMPLIRYDIGDRIHNYSTVEKSVIRFESILGRDNDLIEITEGSFVHPVALIHCIQYIPGILGVQIIQEKDKSISFNMLSNRILSKEDETHIRKNLATLAPTLAECNINSVSQLEQTIAGKTKWIIRR